MPGPLQALTYTDPFGLCEPKPQCEALVHAYEATGALVGAWFGGGGTALTALATGGVGVVAAPGEIAAGTALGAAVGHVVGEVVSFAMSSSGKGASGGSGGQAEPGRDRTAADIISAEKRGAINRVFPEQFRNSTLDQIRGLAQQGDRAAKTALKLLTDSRFNK